MGQLVNVGKALPGRKLIFSQHSLHVQFWPISKQNREFLGQIVVDVALSGFHQYRQPEISQSGFFFGIQTQFSIFFFDYLTDLTPAAVTRDQVQISSGRNYGPVRQGV
jgi:hypothetical protein